MDAEKLEETKVSISLAKRVSELELEVERLKTELRHAWDLVEALGG